MTADAVARGWNRPVPLHELAAVLSSPVVSSHAEQTSRGSAKTVIVHQREGRTYLCEIREAQDNIWDRDQRYVLLEGPPLRRATCWHLNP